MDWLDTGFWSVCSQPASSSRSTGLPSALETWWSTQVCCVHIEEVHQREQESEDVSYYVLANSGGSAVLKVAKLPLRGPPLHCLAGYLGRHIVSFMELRQHFWSFQPTSWITYHVATLLEVAGLDRDPLFILVERVDDRLELMMGVGLNARSFMLEFRANGRARKGDRCYPQPRQVLAPLVTVQQLFDWIGLALSCNWTPYHILQANCQHIAEELQGFLRDPAAFSRRQYELVQVAGRKSGLSPRHYAAVWPQRQPASPAVHWEEGWGPVPVRLPESASFGTLPKSSPRVQGVVIAGMPGQAGPSEQPQEECVVQ